MFTRSGQALSIDDLLPPNIHRNSVVNACPACPEPGMNLQENWEELSKIEEFRLVLVSIRRQSDNFSPACCSHLSTPSMATSRHISKQSDSMQETYLSQTVRRFFRAGKSGWNTANSLVHHHRCVNIVITSQSLIWAASRTGEHAHPTTRCTLSRRIEGGLCPA